MFFSQPAAVELLPPPHPPTPPPPTLHPLPVQRPHSRKVSLRHVGQRFDRHKSIFSYFEFKYIAGICDCWFVQTEEAGSRYLRLLVQRDLFYLTHDWKGTRNKAAVSLGVLSLL